MTAVNLLLVSAGRRVELLRLFRSAYARLGLSGRILATDVDPLAPALHEADARFLTPRVDDPQFVPTLARICRDESVSLVFPLIDPAIPAIAERRTELEATGARLAVVSAEAAETTHDKWRFSQWLASIGVPTPMTWLPENLPSAPPFPLFVKPRFGSAGRQSFRIEDPDDLTFHLRRVEQPLVQAFVEGPEITNDVFCSLEGEVWSVVSRRRIEVRWGEVHKGVTVRNPELLEACVRIARGLGAIGPITIQCLLHEGQPLFTEINARFAGGVPLAVAAGVPAPEWYLRQAAGLAVEPPPLGSFRAGLYLTRYDESFFLEGDGYEPLASGRV